MCQLMPAAELRQAHLQCSSIELREAPPVASSTGEVSRNRCRHCGVDTAHDEVSRPPGKTVGGCRCNSPAAQRICAGPQHLHTGWRWLQHAARQLTLLLLSWQASSALLRMGAIWW